MVAGTIPSYYQRITDLEGLKMSDKQLTPSDYIRAWVMNWQESEDPFFLKVWQVTKNYAKRARTLSTCCGNDGEVGC